MLGNNDSGLGKPDSSVKMPDLNGKDIDLCTGAYSQSKHNGKYMPIDMYPYILQAVEAYATLGEIVSSLKEVFGEYQEPGAA